MSLKDPLLPQLIFMAGNVMFAIGTAIGIYQTINREPANINCGDGQ